MQKRHKTSTEVAHFYAATWTHFTLRLTVDLYDGARLLSHCLIIASEEEHGELRFEYKRMTDVTGEQPLDFYRAPDAPVALLDGPSDH